MRHWLKIKAVGSVSNRQGIGAKIEMTAGGITQRQFVRTGVGFLAAHDTRVHFGLGSSTIADLKVTWPSGQVQHLHNVSADQIFTVTEPSMKLAQNGRADKSHHLRLVSPNDVGQGFVILLALSESPATLLPDGRSLPLLLDSLTAATLGPNPLVNGNVGILPIGGAEATILTPNDPNLAGLRLFATALLYSPLSQELGTIFPQAVTIDLLP